MLQFLFSVLIVFIASCKSTVKDGCSGNAKSKFGTSLNTTRLKFGAPIIHDYMCLESATNKMESWETPADYQKTAKTGFHAGKGIFLKSDAELDEKDIYRHRISDSTFESLGILTEVHNGKSSFPNIWYRIVNENSLFGENKVADTPNPNAMTHLTIVQADSILSAWKTSRK